jgi:bifunctional NMN adenylyltransferase/nudix hydrolase
MNYEFDYLVFIGRFQPFHHGHAKVIETALLTAKHVIVLVGSANRARDWFNPFTFPERAGVIQNWAETKAVTSLRVLKEMTSSMMGINERLTILPLNDYLYDNNGWLEAVQQIVDTAVRTNEKGWTDKPPKIGLIGHAKDHTSYYLGLFPQWGSVNVGAFTDRRLYNSTDVRNIYFSDDKLPRQAWTELVTGLPQTTHKFLRDFRKTDHYDHLYDGHQYILKYRKDHAYANSDIRYDAIHTCVDACVIQSGHVLFVERKAHPGKGLLAMPGGFLNPGETLEDAMLRELHEETKLKVAPRTLRGSITARDIFDEPHRSARGRVLSHTFRIELEPVKEGLPRVRAGSDARKAKWVPLNKLDPMTLFEDHYFIIQNMVARPRR